MGINMIFAYMRVSTKDQNLSRQRRAIEDYEAKEGLKIDTWYADKKSGKNMDREEYKKMVEKLRKGDIVIIKELDRLGRNKKDVMRELQLFREKGVILRVLNIPTTLTDLSKMNDKMARQMMEMINNILIEVYSTIAQQEYDKIHERQAEGIAEVKRTGKTKTGRPMGRPEVKLNQEQKVILESNYKAWKDKNITTRKYMDLIGIKKDVFYKIIKEYQQVQEL